MTNQVRAARRTAELVFYSWGISSSGVVCLLHLNKACSRTFDALHESDFPLRFCCWTSSTGMPFKVFPRRIFRLIDACFTARIGCSEQARLLYFQEQCWPVLLHSNL
jgi:hypothetical protein